MSSIEDSIIFKQDYLPEQVTILEIPSSRLIDDQLETDCHNKWSEMVQEAEATGKQVWDSTVYRYERASENAGILGLSLSTIPFSVRMPMNSFTTAVTQLGFDYAARGMYTSCFVITSDGKYVFIEDADKYLNRCKYMFIGGTLSKTEKELKTGQDLFDEVEKECVEEAGCNHEDIERIVLNAGYITNSQSICLLFTATLNITFPELVERFNAGNDGEAKGLVGITKEEISSFARELNEKEHPKFIVLGLM